MLGIVIGAWLLALLATGWIGRGALGEFPQAAQASTFLDEAAASRRAGLCRAVEGLFALFDWDPIRHPVRPRCGPKS